MRAKGAILGLLVVMCFAVNPIHAAEPITNPCTTLTDFTLPVYTTGTQEGGIATGTGPAGGDCLYIVTRTNNNKTLVWNVQADVRPTDIFSFDIKDAMTTADATVWVNVYHDGSPTAYQPLIQGLTNRILHYSDGWKSCFIRMPVDGSVNHIDRIELIITQSNMIIDFANFTLTQHDATYGGNEIVGGNIINPCTAFTAFTPPVYTSGTQEAAILTGGGPSGGDCLYIVTRTNNNHNLVWNVEAEVIPTDTFSFYIRNRMTAANASVIVSVYHDGSSTPYQPSIVGLATGNILTYADGWKLCSIPMASGIDHIDRIVLGVNQSNMVIDFANFTLTQNGFADCNGIQAFGYGLAGDTNKDCHVDLRDVRMLAQGWLGCTSPGIAGCTNAGYTQTGTIVRGTAVVDANLSEWSNQAEWVLADKVYSGNPQDVNNAKFALRWDADTDKIYAAVVVPDTHHVFVDFEDNTSYDASDRIEVYSQGSAAGGTYSGTYCDIAQQYIIAPGASTGTVWASWPLGYPLMGNPAPGIEYACKVVGNDIVYELGIPMYDNYAGRPGSTGSTVVTQLHTDSIVGLDIVIDSRWDINNALAFGMFATNSDTGKFQNASAFAKYKLVEQTPCGAWGYAAGDVDENCVVDFKDFAKLAQQWLACNDPQDNTCVPNW